MRGPDANHRDDAVFDRRLAIRSRLPGILLVALASCTDFDGLHAAQPSDAGTAADADTAAPLGDGGQDYASEVLRDRPLGYWHFDETTGSRAVDASGHGNDCTYVGAVTLGAPGAVGSAVALDADKTFVRCADVPFDFLDVAAFSLEAIVSPTTVDTVYRKIFSKEDPNAGARRGYDIYVGPPGVVSAERFEGGKQVCAVGVPIDPQVLSHIVSTFDGATLTMYCNGRSATVSCPPTALTDHARPLTIGAQADANYGFFRGRIDEPAVYDIALSPERVGVHYAAWKR